MSDNESKARQLLEQAEKKSKGGGGLFGMFGGSKIDEACELYVKAANLFKMAKKWTEAGNAFVKSAELNWQKGDMKHESATNYADAANCFKKTNPQAAIDCLVKTCEIYTDMGRFTMAAKHHTTIAEMYESECPDPDKAMVHYEKAADYYKGEESKSSANKCMLKVAAYAAQLEQYQKAISIFEEVGGQASDSNLLKYSAKEYFFKALLCHLCVDLLNAQHALKKYEEMHPAFTDSRERKLIQDVIVALEEPNADQFTQAVKEYDKISRLDQWSTSLLLKIKKSCGSEDDDLK